jgi:hypothetical protein
LTTDDGGDFLTTDFTDVHGSISFSKSVSKMQEPT